MFLLIVNTSIRIIKRIINKIFLIVNKQFNSKFLITKLH